MFDGNQTFLSKLFLFLPTPSPPLEGKKKFEQKEKKRKFHHKKH
jgi:hypothetical protein